MGRRTKADKEAIMEPFTEDFLSGMSIRAMAKKYGLTWNWAKKWSLELRSQGITPIPEVEASKVPDFLAILQHSLNESLSTVTELRDILKS